MSDRICPTCKNTFNFPSRLKKHFETVIHCKKTKEQIDEFFVKDTNNNIVYKCNKCQYKFVQKSSLNRHIKYSKCKDINYIPQSNDIAITNNNPSNSNNTTNTTNSNNVITNNNIFIQEIIPYGIGDIRSIPLDEMKMILNFGKDAGIHIIKTIYNTIDNRNFYKSNTTYSDISCLNTDFNLSIYNSKSFCNALFDICIALLHHMIYVCKNEYTRENIRSIYDNIEDIENSMRIEIYDKNIIKSEFINKIENIIKLEYRDKIQRILDSEFIENLEEIEDLDELDELEEIEN